MITEDSSVLREKRAAATLLRVNGQNSAVQPQQQNKNTKLQIAYGIRQTKIVQLKYY